MNNEQIDNTDYYRLPCGKYLEDFIEAKRLTFAVGSALKYRWRAGAKDGETMEKDMAKCAHYVALLDRLHPRFGRGWGWRVEQMVNEARNWKG